MHKLERQLLWRLLPGKKLILATLLIITTTLSLPTSSLDWLILHYFILFPLSLLMTLVTSIYVFWRLHRRYKIPSL